MAVQSRKRIWRLTFFALSLSATFGLTGCLKKSGEAVVIEKVYLPALPTPTPGMSPEPSAVAESSSAVTPSPDETEDKDDGDSSLPTVDPRASDHEQWIITVQMVADLKRIDVRIDQARWQALKINDRVHVAYRQGKYTGTVWGSDLE
jgi:hypothetical protein